LNLIQRVLGFLHRWTLGFFGSLYAFTLGLFEKRHRHLLLQTASHFGYRYQAPVGRPLPTVSLGELFPQGYPLPLRFLIDPKGSEPGLVLPRFDNGGVSAVDLAVLAGLAHTRQPERIFELGTFRGLTTYNMALNAPQAQVWTLDLPPAQAGQTALGVEATELQFIQKARSGEHFAGTAVAPRITQLWGDSAQFDFGPYADSMDFVFVDGSHAYDYVLNDARAALKIAKKHGSIIVFHDYSTWDGVTRALELLQDEADFKGMRHVLGTPVVILEK
jgi:predicted O-methyltransferase YrrM